MFVISIVFFYTKLFKDDCFAAECPTGVKPWLVATFFNFFLLQAFVTALFVSKDRRLALAMFALTTLVFVPYMLVYNVWGNILIETLESEPKCT